MIYRFIYLNLSNSFLFIAIKLYQNKWKCFIILLLVLGQEQFQLVVSEDQETAV